MWPRGPRLSPKRSPCSAQNDAVTISNFANTSSKRFAKYGSRESVAGVFAEPPGYIHAREQSNAQRAIFVAVKARMEATSSPSILATF